MKRFVDLLGIFEPVFPVKRRWLDGSMLLNCDSRERSTMACEGDYLWACQALLPARDTA